MLTRPKTLEYFGMFLVGIGLAFPIQIMFLYGHSPLELASVLAKLTSVNWLVMLAMTVNAVLIFQASPAIKFTIPFTFLVVALNNWIVGEWATDYSPLIASLGTIGFIASHLVLTQSSIMELVKNPDQRWWLRPKRKTVAVTAFVSPLTGVAFKAKTFDVSESGVFIPLTGDEVPPPNRPNRGLPKRNININDRISLCLTLGNLSQIRCDAKVVRRTAAKGTYPAGIGLSFENLTRSTRKELRRYLGSAESPQIMAA